MERYALRTSVLGIPYHLTESRLASCSRQRAPIRPEMVGFFVVVMAFHFLVTVTEDNERTCSGKSATDRARRAIPRAETQPE
jgi:hypothetical protein